MLRNQFTAYPAGGPAQFVNITTLNMEHNLCDRSVAMMTDLLCKPLLFAEYPMAFSREQTTFRN